MLPEVWGTIVVTVLGAVALIVLVLVLRGDRAAAPIRPEIGDGEPLPADLHSADRTPSARANLGRSVHDRPGQHDRHRPRSDRAHPRRPGFLRTSSSLTVDPRSVTVAFGLVEPARRPRSVEDNLQRAFDRIDAVDPYAVPRRIGAALADAGLTDPSPAETWPPRRSHTGPPHDRNGPGPDGAGARGEPG